MNFMKNKIEPNHTQQHEQPPLTGIAQPKPHSILQGERESRHGEALASDPSHISLSRKPQHAPDGDDQEDEALIYEDSEGEEGSSQATVGSLERRSGSRSSSTTPGSPYSSRR